MKMNLVNLVITCMAIPVKCTFTLNEQAALHLTIITQDKVGISWKHTTEL